MKRALLPKHERLLNELGENLRMAQPIGEKLSKY